ncbi:hypothetical protein [Criblamydia sequanensis]|uniref:Leucine-rich repeat-containing protein n=1 Tax=Candidatus Criblamydia sequanensis CRIB-18 TaxID=1437425 RepID=A0A090CYS0_9BACT|nr:hypothetical protein [Criblamydia sequanensis]CDR33706.1 hypothetical protein CSEC_0878 [Criblamydia sequanensis CRIB-18]
MIEFTSVPPLPSEIWELIGHKLIDDSSKKKLNTNLKNFVSIFFSKFGKELEVNELRKDFITNLNRNLLTYTLASKKVTFLDIKFNSLEEEASFLAEHKDSLGTVEFKYPLYSLEEIQVLSSKAELGRISLKGKLDLEESEEKFLALPQIERFKICKCLAGDEEELSLLKIINASLLSIRLGWVNSLSLTQIESFKIESLSLCRDVSTKDLSEAPRNFPKLKKLTFRNEIDSFLSGCYKTADIRKLSFPQITPSKNFFDQLNHFEKLSSLTLNTTQFEESDFLKLPAHLKKLTLVSNKRKAASKEFTLQAHLKYLDISGFKVESLAFLRPTLKTLVISFKHLSWTAFEEALPNLNLKHLTILYFNNGSESKEMSFSHLLDKLNSQENLRSLKLLRSLSINLEVLSSFLKNRSIRHLSLEKSTFVENNFETQFKGLSFQSLDVSDTNISIKELSALSHLRELNIGRLILDYHPTLGSSGVSLNPDNLAILKTINGLKTVYQNHTELRVHKIA